MQTFSPPLFPVSEREGPRDGVVRGDQLGGADGGGAGVPLPRDPGAPARAARQLLRPGGPRRTTQGGAHLRAGLRRGPGTGGLMSRSFNINIDVMLHSRVPLISI